LKRSFSGRTEGGGEKKYGGGEGGEKKNRTDHWQKLKSLLGRTKPRGGKIVSYRGQMKGSKDRKGEGGGEGSGSFFPKLRIQGYEGGGRHIKENNGRKRGRSLSGTQGSRRVAQRVGEENSGKILSNVAT